MSHKKKIKICSLSEAFVPENTKINTECKKNLENQEKNLVPIPENIKKFEPNSLLENFIKMIEAKNPYPNLEKEKSEIVKYLQKIILEEISTNQLIDTQEGNLLTKLYMLCKNNPELCGIMPLVECALEKLKRIAFNLIFTNPDPKILQNTMHEAKNINPPLEIKKTQIISQNEEKIKKIPIRIKRKKCESDHNIPIIKEQGNLKQNNNPQKISSKPIKSKQNSKQKVIKNYSQIIRKRPELCKNSKKIMKINLSDKNPEHASEKNPEKKSEKSQTCDTFLPKIPENTALSQCENPELRCKTIKNLQLILDTVF